MQISKNSVIKWADKIDESAFCIPEKLGSSIFLSDNTTWIFFFVWIITSAKAKTSNKIGEIQNSEIFKTKFAIIAITWSRQKKGVIL